MADLVTDVRDSIRDVPDFPKPGILFKDIAPVLLDPELFERVIAWMAEPWTGGGIDRIVALDARGFLFGGALVRHLGCGLVPVRKAGKLPWQTIGVRYDLEYGTAEVEVHVDAIQPGQRCLVVDDLLATGGTARAAVDLVQKLGGEVAECVFLVELGFLRGAEVLGDVRSRSLVTY